MSHDVLVQTKPGEFEFRMPDLGEGVMEGEIVKWLVEEGGDVTEDGPLVEIMTDKATMEIPAPKTGKLLKHYYKVGEMAVVGKPLVAIAAAGGAAAQTEAAATVEASAPTPAAAPATQAPQVTQAAPAAAAPAPTNGERALASPATRKLARDLNLDLNQIGGTGPHGRVTKDDVRMAAEGGRPAPAAAPAAAAPAPASRPAQPVTTDGEVERIPVRGLRRKIAEKMVQSAYTAPHVTTFDEVDMTALVALRARLKPRAEQQGIKLSFMPFIIKAVIAAIRQFPHFNASMDDTTNELVIKKYIHMGFAAETENGLMVPVVKNADKKSIFTIGKEIPEIAERTRAGKASLDELTGSTFTISNVGSVGGLFATPIINYPEVAILGVNKIEKRPVFRNGEIVVRDMMYLGLSFDHRVIDGAEAVRFLNAVISVLQDPEALFLEL